MKAFFLITEYGHRTETLECVKSIQWTYRQPHEVIIADDGYTKHPQPPIPDTTIVSYRENVGYVRNANRVAADIKDRVAADDVFFVINNDIAFWPDAISRLIDAARSCNKPIVGPAIKVPPKFIGRPDRTPRQFLPTGDPEPVDMTVISGCCLVMQAAVWYGLEGFDERFDCWFSDDDLCIRAGLSGHPVIFIPMATIEHKVNTTMERLGFRARADKAKFFTKYPDVRWSPSGIYQV
jgi:GT2 family glycosyltransferase